MDTPKTCPKCGKALAANAPAGLCPECLMQAGFPTGTEPDIGAKKFSFRPPSVEELKPHFPQLEILSYIGQGGMGAVYKARQPMLDRYVALKILPPEAATGPGFTERFTREARALARLNHPNIVAVHEFGRSRRGDETGGGDGYHYLLMEFVDGVNLREMERAQRLSPAQALSIVPKICEALQYAHDEGVVHRDIKPENILVDKKGRVKIADFGIAKILGAEQPHAPLTGIVGTPHYMSPEQIEKPQTVDHRADIYSVGVVFYEMLTGELPLGRFAAPSKKVQIDVRLDEIVLRALEKEPEQRYQHVSVLKTDVETIATTRPSVSDGKTAREKVTNFFNTTVPLGRFGLWVWASVATVALLFALFVPRATSARKYLLAFIIIFLSAIAGQLYYRRTKPSAAVRLSLWILATVLFLDFTLPHSWHFSAGLRFGFTQPWLFLPHDGYGAIFNPRAVSFFSGIVAALTALALLIIEKRKLNAGYGRLIGSIAVAVLIAAAARIAVEPFKAMNDAITPEINPGSTVFVYKLSHRFRPGDIVVYRWFATGYPTKYLLGRVHELLNDNALSIERRDQEPQKILISDVIGKVVFNTRSSNAADLANSPRKLQHATTSEVIAAGAFDPTRPWAWQELGNRARAGQVTSDEANELLSKLTSWLRREHPNNYEQSLTWLDNLLDDLHGRQLFAQSNEITFLVALCGNPSLQPLPQIRDSVHSIDLMCHFRSAWWNKRFGLEFLNYLESATLDGRPITIQQVQPRDWAFPWTRCELAGLNLTPGKHIVQCEIKSAFVPANDVAGLRTDAPPGEWPAGLRTWKRTCKAELSVYSTNAQMVTLSDDPSLNPVKRRVLTVDRVIIRTVKGKPTAVVSFMINPTAETPLSVDMSLRVGDQVVTLGNVQGIQEPNRTVTSPTALQSTIDPIDPAITNATVILTPDPGAAAQFPSVSNIWGKQILISNMSLVRQDLAAGAQLNQTDSTGLNVITERMVTDAIDLDTGKLIELDSATNGSLGANIAANIRMAEIKGVDAFIEGTNLTALGMKIVAVPDSIWKNDHPELLTNILASSPDAPNVTMQLTQGKPGYYVFKTREGSVGILELLDVLEVQPSVHSIKIRYKVLER